MSHVIAQVTLQRDSGLPEDVIVNTMHFEDDSGFGTSAGIDMNGPGLMDRLVTFYQAIQSVLAGTLNGQGEVTLYDWGAPKPRVPYMSKPFTLTPSTSSLPGEVALALSYRAERTSGQSMARRRGRVFLGPIAAAAIEPVASGAADPRPGTGTIDMILNAAKTMATGGSGAFRLAVYSPTTMAAIGGTADAAWNDVVAISIDNAWDVIRARGAKATARRQILIAGTDPISNV